ncbi:Fluoroquinolones export ATP-binding protein [compost metagenome]
MRQTELALPPQVASMPDWDALKVEDVTKVYPARWGRPPLTAVNGVSFGLNRGEILGLLGPNGAGKTTTIKMIAGLLRPTSGRIAIGPHDVAHDRSKAASRLGAVLEGNRNLHWKLTVTENLSYFGTLKGVADVKAKADELIARLDLGDHRKKRVGELSRGLQQRVAIAIALLNSPQLLLLDEPTLGLDVVSASTFKDIVRAIAQDGCGIVLTTHQMEVAQELSDRIAIIAGGKLAVMDSLEQLQAAHRTPGYEITVRGTLDSALQAALEGLGAQAFAEEGALSRFVLPEGNEGSLYQAFEPLRAGGLELVSVRQQEVNLEEIYRRVIGGRA